MVNIYTEKIGDIWFGVAFEGETIYGTSFASNEKNTIQGLREGVLVQDLSRYSPKTDFAKHVIITLKDIYDGKDVSHNFSFAKGHLSKYARRVIEVVCEVPPGYVTSYGAVAKVAGGGPRAVGQIMASNPYAPICPCHRVVRSDFTLGGYGGGLDVKLAFLKRERRGYAVQKEIPVNGKKLQVHPAELAIKKAEEG